MYLGRQWLFAIRYGSVPIIGLLLIILNYYALFHNSKKEVDDFHKSCPSMDAETFPKCSPKYSSWLRMKSTTTKHLIHIENTFTSYDYDIIRSNHSVRLLERQWNVLWSHAYPFQSMKSYIQELKLPHCINHFPAIGFITNKVLLATSKLDFIPRAFQIPSEVEKLKKYALTNPNKMFVQKSSDHRGISIKKLEELDLTSDGTFIQEFLHDPLLINGHKFDIGVYVVLTSVDPLRVYMYEGDVLFRFCPEKYFPFSPEEPDKYVVGDDYLPTWKVADLKDYYLEQGLGMKASFDAWMRSRNKNPETIWTSVRENIRQVFYAKEEKIAKAITQYSDKLRFFELMRFDFIISDTNEVYLMEANMSPNLSSAHFKENTLLYEQVMRNVLSLIGVTYKQCALNVPENEKNMIAAIKDIVVFPEYCAAHCKTTGHCTDVNCQLCATCLKSDDIRNLKMAYSENLWKGECSRLIPKMIDWSSANKPTKSEHLSASNTLMAEWFRGKCLLNQIFC